MDAGDDGSSTESEYYDLSEEEELPLSSHIEIHDLSGHVDGHLRGNDAETITVEAAEVDHIYDDEDANLTAFTTMAAQWNNILTPDLAAAVARVAAHTSRRGREPPLAIPLDPPVETLPHSTEFVSPFAALAAPAPQLHTLKKEIVVLPLGPAAAEVETKQEVVETPRSRVPARVVIDLSLDSDDDEEDAVLVRRLPTPPAQPVAAASVAPPPPSTPTPVVPPCERRAIVSDIPSAPMAHSQPPPASHRENSSIRPAASASVTPAPPPVPPSVRAVKLTLSCTRCHRLVPDHSAAPPDRARFDCKCCGRKYAQEELSVRGANRRCMFCKILTPQPGVPPSSATPSSVDQPQTPQSAADTAAYEASISPAAASPRVAQPHAQSRHTVRSTDLPSSVVSRPATMVPSPRPVAFTCVTCHQPLQARQSLASAQQELDPWFCTCCQRLLCMKDSPPDKGPIGTNPKAIPRCVCCAIAACDLDSQLESRRPNLEPLQGLRRLSRLLQNMMNQLIQKLKNSKRDGDVKTTEQDPIKLEINKRYMQWKGRMLSVRSGQRRTLRRDNVTLQQQRAMFKEQLALEQAEVDVRSRLVAFLAVNLHAHRVKLPREVRGIVGDDSRDTAPAAHSRPQQQSRNPVPQPTTTRDTSRDRVQARSRTETEKSPRSHGSHRRPFSSIESAPPVSNRDTREKSSKRPKDSRYLAYETTR